MAFIYHDYLRDVETRKPLMCIELGPSWNNTQTTGLELLNETLIFFSYF